MRFGRARWLRMAMVLALTLVVSPGWAAARAGGADVEVVASGLRSPRGLAFGAGGALYVAESGAGGADPCTAHPILGETCVGRTGAVTRVWHGKQTRVVRGLPSIAGPTEALGPHDVAPTGRGRIYVTVGLGGSPKLRAQFGSAGRRLGHLLLADVDGDRRAVSDLAAYEAEANPAGGPVDSNPFGVLSHRGQTLVADAGGNALVSADRDGDVSTVAVFPNREVLFGGQKIPMNAVPTTVVRHAGAYYVGQLTGFPFPVGGARIFRVEPGEDPTVYAGGFTNIIDIAFDDDGALYVLEIAHNSLLAAEPEGALIKVDSKGHRSVVLDGLFFPGGVAIGRGGDLYVTNCGICASEGEVLRVSP